MVLRNAVSQMCLTSVDEANVTHKQIELLWLAYVMFALNLCDRW